MTTLRETTEEILQRIEAKQSAAFERAGIRPTYLILGEWDYDTLCGILRLYAAVSADQHVGDLLQAEGLTVVRVATDHLLEVGW